MTDQDSIKVNLPIVSREAESFDFRNFDKAKGLNTIVDEDGTHKEYQSQSYGYIIRITPRDSYFQIIKKFNHKGSITEKGLAFFSGGFKKGTWYYFDEGRLVKEEDNDKPFKFSFTDLLKYLQKQKIPLTMGHFKYGYHTEILNEVEHGKPKWFVNWLKEPTKIEELTIDGNNGKVLDRTIKEYVNN